MSVSVDWVILGLGIPAAAAALIALFGLKPRGGREASPPRAAGTWAILIAAGMALALPMLHGMPAEDAWGRPLALMEWHRWLWFGLLPMAVAGVLLGWPGRPRWIGLVLGAVTTVAVLVGELWGRIQNTWEAGETTVWIAGLSAGTLALAAGGHWLSKRAGRELPPILGLTAVGAGLTVAFSGSESIGLTLVCLGAVMAGGGAMALFAGCRSAYGSAVPSLFVLAAMLSAAYFLTYNTYADEPGVLPIEALALAFSPLLGLLSDAILPRRMDHPVVRATARTVITLAPIVAVTVRAGLRFAATVDETGAYY